MYQTLSKIRELVKAEVGSKIRTYFLDDPILINMSSLPCIAIVPVRTEIEVLDNARDKYTHFIDVFLIINALTEVNKAREEMVGMQFLTKLMEEKESTGILKENTILYAVRNNLNLAANWKIENVGTVDYGVRVRSEQVVTLEAWTRLSVSRTVNRP